MLDGAHNPGGLAALAEALPEFVAGRRLVACLAVLDDKDAAEMLRILLPLCDAVVATRGPTPRALSPATIASLVEQLSFDGTVEVVGEPRSALQRARALAGEGGVALATGSIYLIADLLRPVDRARARYDARPDVRMSEDDAPRVGVMIAAVAVIVALVILVFFGIGYGFGRLFL